MSTRLPNSFRGMIPRGAEETRSEDSVGFSTVRYFVEARLALMASFERTGRPVHAMTFDAEGRAHGLEREWHSSGRLRYEARYVDGLQHGLQRQWDEQGRLIVRTRFVRGTGLDLYCGDLRPGVGRSPRSSCVDGRDSSSTEGAWIAVRTRVRARPT